MYFDFKKKEYYKSADEKDKDISVIECQFKSLIKKHHPDNGGNHSIFVLLPEEKEELIKIINSTRIVDKEIIEIEKFIRENNHTRYPDYPAPYAKKLWNYYSFLYNFEKSFSLLYDYDEIKWLNENANIYITFRLYSKADSYRVQIYFKSDRKTIDPSIDIIFQGLRKKLTSNFPGLIFIFYVDYDGSMHPF